MDKNNPIGVFDSGVGGSSIWQEIHKLLPFENVIYLADSKNAPYGNKSSEEIIALSIKNVEKLRELDCKIIVVACNTATTNAVWTLRENYKIPIIGIEPAIKPAALQTTSKSVGILATKGTLSSTLFSKTAKEFTKDISVVEIIGEGLVLLIEAGKLDSPEMISLLKTHTKPMIEANIDYLVLGCSHYPYLIPQLKKILPENVKIIDSGEAVARQTKTVLQSLNLLREENTTPKLQFYTNAETDTLKLLLKDFAEKISIEKRDF
ncbi:glutamate racemase [Aequorivita sublithincola DSM 14238]|uniref:Glutamate racemase n=1 Tax=Aequorivita sublithincola (strain DSM 14238 / LMG 21431 / ACAM 643 / 9-3) TaxID=746697 RepID=I3YTN0_AEQSU|nr:glutamate racemase [Aequorivita sublithincola]AFL80348.1 glutamate racemase [Aequorivita sublithincola DSM 14238]